MVGCVAPNDVTGFRLFYSLPCNTEELTLACVALLKSVARLYRVVGSTPASSSVTNMFLWSMGKTFPFQGDISGSSPDENTSRKTDISVRHRRKHHVRENSFYLIRRCITTVSEQS